MAPLECSSCGTPMIEGRGEFRDLSGPAVAITGVPAFVCACCGRCRFTREVLLRLSVILRSAIEHAENEGLPELQWSFTPDGLPALGRSSVEARRSPGRSRELAEERRVLADATRRAISETPLVFH